METPSTDQSLTSMQTPDDYFFDQPADAITPEYLRERLQPPAIRLRTQAYWRENFPVRPERLRTASEAVSVLRERHLDKRSDGETVLVYPWRLARNAATGLPTHLRTWLDPPPDRVDDEKALDAIQSQLANGLYAAAIFGYDANVFSQEFASNPVLRLETAADFKQDRPEFTSRHFGWRQTFQGLRVIGGSVRVHDGMGDERAYITSSYFPIADRPPSLDPATWLAPTLLRTRALQSFAYATPTALFALIDVLDHLQDPTQNLNQDAGLWYEALLSVAGPLQALWIYRYGRHLDDGQWFDEARSFFKEMLRMMIEMVAGSGAELANLLRARLGYGDWGPATLEPLPVPIEGRRFAILPFDGGYHLISRWRLQTPRGETWFVDIDMHTGEALGRPWQMTALANDFFLTSGEAIAGPPSGDSGALDKPLLESFVTNGADLCNGDADARTIAFHAVRIFKYLRDTCGVPAAKLKASPKFRVETASINPTGFDWGAIPPAVRFEADFGGGISTSGGAIFNPARDPEVVMHEFAHAFLWRIDPEPWDTPFSLNPFARALHEGYATYLSRSIAGQPASAEEDEPWARAAYRPGDWDDRWRLDRGDQILGADFLPTPNVFPPSTFIADSLETYDAGMVWARALWDMRQILGRAKTDWLLVQAYPYLHGYIANFELAAEAMIDVALRATNSLSLGNGSQPLWANRGIAAGQGILGFAQVGGALIAASNAGILELNAGAWTLQTGNLAGGKTLSNVVTVLADGATLYAAAQVPTQTGGQNQWDPGVYWFDSANNRWREIGNWSAQTQNASPLCLLSPAAGELLVGTSKGVFRRIGANDAGSWQAHGSTNTSGAFSANGLAWATNPAGGARLVRTISQADAYELDWPSPANTDWLKEDNRLLSGAFGGSQTERLTTIVGSGNSFFIGALTGIYSSTAGSWAAVRVGAIADPVLASTTDGVSLWFATPTAIYTTSLAALNPQPLPPLPVSGARVLSLYVSSAGALRAGTLAHGVFRLDPGGWQPEPTPTATTVWLARNELGLLSWRQTAPASVAIQTPPAMTLLAVAQPDFPFHVLQPSMPGGSIYNLAAGPVILLVRNGNQAGNASVQPNGVINFVP